MADDSDGIRRGGCLCGGVGYELRTPPKEVVACHCSQCAKTSGNFAVMASCERAAMTITRETTLRWFRSSPQVRRGFCDCCGSNLFWHQDDADEIYVTLGTLNAPTRLKLERHIFVGSKSDFYEILGGLPEAEEY